MKLYFVFLLLIGLQGCVAYPEVAWNRADYKRCDLITRELEFKVTDHKYNGKVQFRSLEELVSFLVATGVVFSTSAVITGSIVIAGNTIHFLEKQGRCDDSFLHETINAFIKPFIDKGGELAEDSKLIEVTKLTQSSEYQIQMRK